MMRNSCLTVSMRYALAWLFGAGIAIGCSARAIAADQSYYGIHITGEKIAFLLDVSGSMEDKREDALDQTAAGGILGGLRRKAEEKLPPKVRQVIDRERTKLGAARRELIRALEHLSGDTYFTIITFGHDVTALPGGFHRVSGISRRETQVQVYALGASGDTPMSAALKNAFAASDIDTIFLVSDGRPTDASAADILAQVRTSIRGRNIVVNTVGIGADQDAQLLCDLAKLTGGFYVTDGKIACHTGVCDDPETRTVYEPGPRYHHYEKRSTICSTKVKGCTPDFVYSVMLSRISFVAPTTSGKQTSPDSPVSDCGITILEPGNDPIRSVVERSALSVQNYTRVGHVFHPGRVTRTVQLAGRDVTLKTVGEGVGPDPWANQNVFDKIWTCPAICPDARLAARVRELLKQ